MSKVERNTFTLVRKRYDGRVKGGVRVLGEYLYEDFDDKFMEEELRELNAASDEREFYEARKWVERENLMTGKKFLEDPDRPSYLSPASESYWSM